MKTDQDLIFETYMENNKEETITIPLKEYKSLKEDEAFLAILEENGVDSWGGYDGSVEIFQNEYKGPRTRFF